MLQGIFATHLHSLLDMDLALRWLRHFWQAKNRNASLKGLLLLPQGIFATHLHSLLDMDLAVRRLRRMRMETENDGRFIRATMRMLPGACTESLALAVAAACRVPDEVVSRAESHYAVRISRYDTQLMDMSPPPAASPTRSSAVRSRTTRCVILNLNRHTGEVSPLPAACPTRSSATRSRTTRCAPLTLDR